ncbi:hypothetical protein [Myxococcus sp. CA040A]|uniref:hypothetical protein n=1 Tax=Myxococcus sp. CA040A TaxID=2741738 RepID=UPI00157B3136|nr:hypothetical protein [Myxococcus sp. CA040A]NTX07518.1 hypothetical protein [Myxococcus sp. CA040A]
MSDGALFSTDTVSTEARYQWHLWTADLLDVATSALVGWAALRAMEHERTPVAMVLAMVLSWLAWSAVGGIWGRTLWRQLLGVRLVRNAGAPGAQRGLVRAFTTPVDLLVAPVLQRRPFDTMLGLYAEPVTAGAGARLKGMAPQLPWLALLAGAVWLLVTPTRAEMLKYLGSTLTGWHCCHGTRDVTWECRTSLNRAVREANSGREDVRAVVADCPVASERLARP